MNLIILKGRLTENPTLELTSSNYQVCRFRFAVPRRDKNNTTDFFSCTAFNNYAVFLNDNLEKGQEIIITGSMQSNTKDVNGERRTYYGVAINNVEFCGPKVQNNQGGYNGYNGTQYAPNNYNQQKYQTAAPTPSYQTNTGTQLPQSSQTVPPQNQYVTANQPPQQTHTPQCYQDSNFENGPEFYGDDPIPF